MTADPAPMTAVQYAARAVGDQLIVLAEAQHESALGVRIGPGGPGGFARDFATADGQRVMVAAFTQKQFADLAQMTRLAGTFAFLERVLHADFSERGDLYAHRGAIATLLAPWFPGAPWPTWPRRSGEPRCHGRASTASTVGRAAAVRSDR
jgi:hypothetical protein